MTGAGTNTYVYGFDGCLVIDPGVDDEAHLAAVAKTARERGGIEAVLISHQHPDHVGGAEKLGAPVIHPAGGQEIGGLKAIHTPGHAADHMVFVEEPGHGACFCADLVLGEGSSFVPPDGGSLIAYLDSLRRLRDLGADLLCPGHGPWITEPAARIDAYIEHRLDRERRLLAAFERGVRSREALLDEVWDDTPRELRDFTRLVLQAHLEKLELEGRLAAGWMQELD